MKQEAPTSLGGSSSQSSSNRHYTITGYANEEVYNKYIADCDKFTMYQKVCNVVYQSTNGRPKNKKKNKRRDGTARSWDQED